MPMMMETAIGRGSVKAGGTKLKMPSTSAIANVTSRACGGCSHSMAAHGGEKRHTQ
jgi:hypothetical protein